MKPEDRNNIEHLNYGAIRYLRYTDRCSGHERGTVILLSDDGERLVRDYPHICRVYRLHNGISHYFGDDYFFAEEKLDGYNVRIVKHDDELVAITRGGFICPFSTEWVQFWKKKFRLDDFFKLYPDRVICAEFVGDNPYNSKRDNNLPPGLSFFCFDIMLGSGRLIPAGEKYEIFSNLGIPQVPRFGRFTIKKFADLREIILDLNINIREGIILKGEKGNRAIKFVTAESDLNDIKNSLAYFYDINPGFYSNRLMRISLFVQEFNLDQNRYFNRIGEAVLKGYSFLEGYDSSLEIFRIYMHSTGNWRSLKELIIQHKDIVEERAEPVEIGGVKMYKIVFGRKHKKSTDRFREIISGHEE